MIERRIKICANSSYGGVFVYNLSSQLLEQYPFEVTAIQKGRGTYICTTSEGGKIIIGSFRGSKGRAEALEHVLLRLKENGIEADEIIHTREGEILAQEVDETWYYADDHSLNLNQDRIKAMILKVAPLKADQVIENVTDMSQYGLADPERTIQYETADRSVIINVGNLNSMTSQYYIAFPSEMKVYVVATNVVTGFNYTLDDLVEKTTEETESTETAETAKMESENSEAATETTETVEIVETETAAAEAD